MIKRFHWPDLLRSNARFYQIAALTLLLVYGMFGLDLDVTPGRAALLMTTVVATQAICSRLWRLPVIELKSALISGLSLCLLLRTNSSFLAVLTAAVTILSKFVLRWKGKHVFNPTNFGLVFMLLSTHGAIWVSPAQWGNPVFFAFLLACIGVVVVTRAARADVTLTFLAAYTGLIFARSIWLGEPFAIPLHRLQNGALLIFSFFMISDPKTTPDSRSGRIVFGLLVAVGVAFVQFKLFRTNGLLWSLAAFSTVVPLLDWLLPGRKYSWHQITHTSKPNLDLQSKTKKENVYEPVPA